jgi:predicted nucleic acid-binding protein
VKAIFDSCVAVKWIIAEEDSEKARRILDFGQPGSAPSLVLAEMNNAIWKQLYKGQWTAQQAFAVQAIIPRLFKQLVPIEILMPRASAMMIEIVHPVYDCIYLALAERESIPLVTVDQRLIEAGKKLGSVEIIHLRDL